MNALVLAGGPPDAVARLVPGVPNKAFVPVGGVPLVTRVIAAVREVARIEAVTVVAPPVAHAWPALAGADRICSDGPRMIDSLRSGLAGAAADQPVLVLASDLPVLTTAAIDEVLDALARRELDLAYTCLERRYHDARYAQFPHTWARMREGAYCGGGVTALTPRALEPLATFLDALGAARKAPLRLAAIFGWPTLVRFALRALSISAAEARASALLGVPVGAIACTHPEIAINVDRPSDVALADALIAG